MYIRVVDLYHIHFLRVYKRIHTQNDKHIRLLNRPLLRHRINNDISLQIYRSNFDIHSNRLIEEQ